MGKGGRVYYKGYWMVTNRCNLNCSYCVLEDAPHQLKQELDLEGKKELLSHLYRKLDFRRLTLSGGEVLLIGKRPPKDFIELLHHIKTFRSNDPKENLEIELYTNGTYLTDEVAEEMRDVVDLVAVTIDSSNQEFLTSIGRNNTRFNRYYEQIIEVCGRLTKQGIKIKIHTVVSSKNYRFIAHEVEEILEAIHRKGGQVEAWKFYQYMSYDAKETDLMHAIDQKTYEGVKEKVLPVLEKHVPVLHFKDNGEMNASLFNILSYGNAQYMRPQDTWSTTPRTDDLRSYQSMEELFLRHDLDKEIFCSFHGILR